VTIGSYLRILRERWKLILAFVVVSTAIAVVVTAITPKQYEATAQVFVSVNGGNDPLAQAQASVYTQTQVLSYASIANAPDILHLIQQDLNLPMSDSELRSKITATARTGESIVDITVTDSSASEAAAIANSAARAFSKVIEQYSTVSGSSTPFVRVIPTDPAVAPSSPSSPQPVLNITLGILLGLLFGVAFAVIRDVMDTRIKSVDALSKASGAPTMGMVVDDSGTSRAPVAARSGGRGWRAENYRQLRANLQFANLDEHPRIIAVTSSVPDEGKSVVAVNLATTLAEAGFTVCLVDADLRRPTASALLGLPSAVGLTSVLLRQVALSDALQNAGHNLQVLASGPIPPNPSEVLASAYVRDVVRALLDRVDYVIVDTAPLLPVADGSEVAALADGTLLIARHGVTTEAQVREATANLRRVDAKLIGVVLNRVPERQLRGQGGPGYSAMSEPKTRRPGRRGGEPKPEAPVAAAAPEARQPVQEAETALDGT
jgi:non-specific protein-tyrosine kinase